MSTKPLIIIGSGSAGYTLATFWRKLEPSQPLIIFTENNGDFYHKPMLSTIFSKQKTLSDLVSKTSKEMASSLNAIIHTHCKVHQIDSDQKILHTDEGEFEYDQCVLATGSIPKEIPNACKLSFQINSLDDYSDFLPSLNQHETVQIVGAGLIGCELTHDLLHHGKKIMLISNTQWPLAELVPDPIGRALHDYFIERGVQYVYEQQPQFNNDLLTIFAVGLQHDTSAFKQFEQSPMGFHTNALGQTNIQDIYAIGDCAHLMGMTLRYISPIRISAQAIAKTLTGTPTPIQLNAIPVTVKTHEYPIVSCKHPTITGQWKEETSNEPGIIMMQYNEDGEKIGFSLSDKNCQLRTKIQVKPWL